VLINLGYERSIKQLLHSARRIRPNYIMMDFGGRFYAHLG
jgi:hypothetical protein